MHGKKRDKHQKNWSPWVPTLIFGFVHSKQRISDQNYTSLWVPAFICGFVHSKHRNEHQNYKSLWVPDLTCRFVHAKQRDWHQKILASMGPRVHLSLCACKTAWFATENTSLYGSQTSPVVLCMQNGTISTRITISNSGDNRAVPEKFLNISFVTLAYLVKNFCLHVLSFVAVKLFWNWWRTFPTSSPGGCNGLVKGFDIVLWPQGWGIGNLKCDNPEPSPTPPPVPGSGACHW